jgi:hypothetical protein
LSSLSLSISPWCSKWSIAQPGWKSSSNLEQETNPTNKKHRENPKRQDILVILERKKMERRENNKKRGFLCWVSEGSTLRMCEWVSEGSQEGYDGIYSKHF